MWMYLKIKIYFPFTFEIFQGNTLHDERKNKFERKKKYI